MKLLSCRKINSKNTLDIFALAGRGYNFTEGKKKWPTNRALVVSYTVITDGHDILAHVGQNGTIDVGMPVAVSKPAGLLSTVFHSPSRFNAMIQRAIISNFLTIFDTARARRKIAGGDTLEDELLSKRDLTLTCTKRAIVSLDGLQIYPIYILNIGSLCPIILPPSKDSIVYAVMSINLLKNDTTLLIRMPHVARIVSQMIALEAINLPTTRNDRCFDTGGVIS